MKVDGHEDSINSQAWDEIYDRLVLALDLVSSGPRDAVTKRHLVSHLVAASEVAQSCFGTMGRSAASTDAAFQPW